MNFKRSGTFVGVALLGLVGTAHAAPINGVGDPISEPALSGGTVIDFDSGPTGQFSSITFGDVTFTGVGADLTIGPDFNGDFNTSGGNSLFNDFDFVPDAFRFDFDTPVEAFAFNWGASDNLWLLSAFDSGGSLLESSLLPIVSFSNAGEYFGIATPGISFATLVDQKDTFPGGDFVFIDDFTFSGNAVSVSVPEPSALSLTLLTLAGLGLAMRRRRANSGAV